MRTKKLLILALVSISFFGTSVFAITQSSCSGTASFTDTSQVQPGTMFVIANMAQANFTITGPANYQINSPAWFAENIPAGTYTITWGPIEIEGCEAPPPETKTTDARGSVSFVGNYKDLTPFKQYGRIEIGTNLTSQTTTFTISGPSTKTAEGTGFTWASAPAGIYTVTYGNVEKYITPLPETKTLEPEGYVSFYGTYQVEQGNFLTVKGPTGTRVYFDEVFAGMVPVTRKLTYGKEMKIRCSLDGYADHTEIYPAIAYNPTSLRTESSWTCTLAKKGGSRPQDTGTIIVKVSPIREADFRIIGPENRTLSRATSLMWPNAPAGTYTVTYGKTPEEGFVIPPPETKTLKGGETLMFEGIYQKESRSVSPAIQESQDQEDAPMPPQKPKGFFKKMQSGISSFFSKIF